MERHIIKQIALEQKQEISELFRGRIVEREIGRTAKTMFDSGLIKVIMGVRRCGKSILAHQSMKKKNYGYVNFDDERLIRVQKEDLNHFLEALQEINPGFNDLLLDEVQNVEGWELFVNRLKRKGYAVTVTGSNARLLSRELATHLTGRHFGIELYPFSFREFLSYKGISAKEEDFYITERRALINSLFEEYMESGGFPETFTLSARRQYLRELFDKIITRDIVLRNHIKHIHDLKEVALYALSNFGSRITYHKIRNIFEIKSVHTIKKYLNYLQETFLVFQLDPFSFKLKEQMKQPRKLYAIDTGIINALVPKMTLDYGRLMENLVFLELKRRGKEIYYYPQPAYEVDFVIQNGSRITQLIQVCHSLAKEETKKREIKGLLKASDPLKCRNLLIITRDQEGEERIDSSVIRIIPVWKWLLEEKPGKSSPIN